MSKQSLITTDHTTHLQEIHLGKFAKLSVSVVSHPPATLASAPFPLRPFPSLPALNPPGQKGKAESTHSLIVVNQSTNSPPVNTSLSSHSSSSIALTRYVFCCNGFPVCCSCTLKSITTKSRTTFTSPANYVYRPFTHHSNIKRAARLKSSELFQLHESTRPTYCTSPKDQ